MPVRIVEYLWLLKKRNSYGVRLTILIFWLLHFSFFALSQSGFYIPQQGKIYFAGDTATILSNVINHGNFGIGNKATINFKGQTWQNDPLSRITDETSGGAGVAGQGGIVRFMADTGRQRLVGGYNAATKAGPVFANLHLVNPFGVELTESSAKVWQEVKFAKGHFYLNNQAFVIGHQQPGRITGYDSTRFFVTGVNGTGSWLIRENVSALNGQVVFPVGTTSLAYTPAALRSRVMRGDDFYASVMDGVKTNGLSGNSLADISVNKTWQIGKRYFPGEDEVELSLQHLNADEGPQFYLNRNRSYVSQYLNNKWDEGSPQVLPAPGSLTTSTIQRSSGVNTRTIKASLSSLSYFTKFASKGELSNLRTNIIFGAYRTGAYIVRVNWQTKPEINVKRFVVERKRTNEPAFVPIDSLASLAVNGFSTNYLNYGINDNNSYRGITFYKLKIVGYNDSSYYLPMVAVRGVSLDVAIGLWPNPTAGKFSIIVSGHVASYVVIHNSLGQLMWKEEVAGRNVIELQGHQFAAGIYYVSILGMEGQKLRTEKLNIIR